MTTTLAAKHVPGPLLDPDGIVLCPCEQQDCGHSVASIPDETGDTRHMWDKNNPDEVVAARTLFEEMTAKGYRAYKAEGKRGDRGDLMRKFDPAAERVIFFRANVAG
jgi:hypothetical protein